MATSAAIKYLGTALLSLLGLVSASFLAVFIAIPALNSQTVEPVYARDFQSRAITTAVGNGGLSVSTIRGQVTVGQDRPSPALVRIYNAARTPRKIDIVAQQYTDLDGRFELEVAPGDYEVLVTKGPEFEYFFSNVTAGDGDDLIHDVRLHRIADMAASGWYGGDPHQHSTYSDGADDIEDLLVSNVAMGLHFSTQTDHNSIDQNPHALEWALQVDLTSDSGDKFLVIGGNEVTTDFGHMNVWEPKNAAGDYVLIDPGPGQGNDSADARRNGLLRILRDMDEFGEFKNINHPFAGNVTGSLDGARQRDTFMDEDFDWLENLDIVTRFDATETWNGGSGFMNSMYYFGSDVSHPFEAMHKVFHEWYRVLNTGVRFPSVGSSDTHNNKASRYLANYDVLVTEVRNGFGGFLPWIPASLAYSMFGDVEGALMYQELDEVEYGLEEVALIPGSPRTYVYTGGELSSAALAANIGHSFITSGPLLLATIDGAMPGETVAATATSTLRLDVISHKPLHKLMVIADGELVFELPLDDVMRIERDIELDLAGRKWAIVYVEGNFNYAYAFTNPIYLE